MLDLSSIDLEEIAHALADQAGYEHQWLINPQTGQIAFWTAGTGIDGQTPAGLDELARIVIDPLHAAGPSWNPMTLLTPASLATGGTEPGLRHLSGSCSTWSRSTPATSATSTSSASSPTAGSESNDQTQLAPDLSTMPKDTDLEAYAKPSEAAPSAACLRRSESFLIIFMGSFA
ncbi:MAG TPA: hypothetical protein VF933_25575 [Streptosporangiaceae bacterium]